MSLLEAWGRIAGPGVIAQLRQLAGALTGPRVVHVNSTRVGGGVAEGGADDVRPEPGRESGRGSEPVESLPRREQGVLDRVRGVGMGPGQDDRGTQCGREVGFHEGRERPAVAVDRGSDEPVGREILTGHGLQDDLHASR